MDREQFQKFNPELALSKLEPFLVDRGFRPFCAQDTLQFNDAEHVKQALTSLSLK